MIRYTVTTYSFKKPGMIYESEYWGLKQKLQNDPDFTLIDKEDTITNEFGDIFKKLIGLAVCAIICSAILSNDIINNDIIVGILCVLTAISFMVFFTMLIMSIPPLSSYAGYLRKKRKYFTRMEKEIRKSTDYMDFCINFYK